MKKRLAALILAMAAVLMLLPACGDGAAEDTQAPQTEAPVTDSAEEKTEPPAETEDTEAPESIFPLSEEGTAFSMWTVAGPLSLAGMSDYNESEFYKYMEKMTNVHIDFALGPAGEEETNFNIILASGDYMDAFAVPDVNYYVGGLDKAIEDEIIIPIEDYSEYYPNYNKCRSIEDVTLYNTVTPNGHIGAIYQMKIPQATYQGPIIRMDLLQSYGYEKTAEDIVTLDDWGEVLELFAANGIKTPWWGEGNFMLGFDEDILPAFGIYITQDNMFYQLGDEVKFGPAEESLKDYLKLYSDWYAKGYISKDFTSHMNDINGDEPAEMEIGNVGIGVIPQASFDEVNNLTEGGSWTGIPIPLSSPDQKVEAPYIGELSRSYFNATALSITTDCDEELIPIILQYFDYLFTDEGSTLANYGVEGVSWHPGDDGYPVFEDFMANSPDGWSLIGQFAKYCCFHVVPFLYDYKRELGALSEEAASLPSIWESNYADEIDEYPNLTVPVDIATEYNNIYHEIETYVEEYALTVITGGKDVDASWDEYLETLDSMGVDYIIQVQQDAYDSFFSKDVTVGMN